jgi:hypothetical protein
MPWNGSLRALSAYIARRRSVHLSGLSGSLGQSVGQFSQLSQRSEGEAERPHSQWHEWKIVEGARLVSWRHLSVRVVRLACGSRRGSVCGGGTVPAHWSAGDGGASAANADVGVRLATFAS